MVDDTGSGLPTQAAYLGPLALLMPILDEILPSYSGLLLDLPDLMTLGLTKPNSRWVALTAW